jgi:hypothetical protein
VRVQHHTCTQHISSTAYNIRYYNNQQGGLLVKAGTQTKLPVVYNRNRNRRQKTYEFLVLLSRCFCFY